MENSIISIITVCYNSAKTIEQTIQSVLRQSSSAYEYIIIDGGSSDGTVDIIRKYENDIAYWVSEPDGGIYDAMNKGLARATGNYIAFLNSDDWYLEDTVETVIKAFSENESDIIYGERYRLKNDDSLYFLEKPFELDVFYYRLPICHQATFVKRNVFDELGGFDTAYRSAGDYDWFLRAYLSGVSFYYLSKPLCYFRGGGTSFALALSVSLREQKDISLKHLPDSKKAELTPVIERWYEELLKMHVLIRMDDFMSMNIAYLRKLWSEYVEVNESLYIWGCGAMGKNCLRYLLAIGAPVKSFVDADPSKWHSVISDIEILDPNILQGAKVKVIVTPEKSAEEIKKKLAEWGYKEKEDFFLYADIIRGIAEKIAATDN